jgi:hypothetical protein
MTTPQPSWRRRWLRVLGTGVGGTYLLLVLLITVFQRELLFIPTTVPLVAAQQIAAGQGWHPWLNPGGGLIGWQFPSPGSATGPVTGRVLIVHGNGGWALDRMDLGEAIHDATGLEVYILEYPGYGSRAGSPSETSFLAAADEAWVNLPHDRPAYVVSESLGTGVAAHLAQKHPDQVAGLLMFVPYDRLALVAQHHYPFLPAYFLLRDRFDPADWLAGYRGPVKIVIAGADEIIPPIRGQKLYDGYQGPKTLQIIPRAHHNETIGQSPGWWRSVLGFWETGGRP